MANNDLTSKIILCKNIKMDRDNLNVLSYTEAQMLTLVNSTGIKAAEKSDYSFIGRGDRSAINVDIAYSTCLSCNYMAFQNTNYNNKWYFAFIDRVEYINDLTTRIYYTVDIFHTWLDYWSNKACFIIREHVNDDTVGANTIPENFELGEYICQGKVGLFTGGNSAYIAVATSYVPDDYNLNTFNTQYGGVYSGTPILLMEDPLSASNFIRGMDALAKKDAIVAIYMVPQAFKGNGTFSMKSITVGQHSYTSNVCIPQYTSSADTLNSLVTVSRPTTIDGYTPVNKKLLVFPYQYFFVTNNAGSDVTYHFEDFIDGSSPQFLTYGVMTPGCSIRVVPWNYKKLADTAQAANRSYDYGVTGPKYPICSWATDVYTNWLTENGINQAITYATSGLAIAGGVAAIATGAGAAVGAGMIMSGAAGIAGELKQEYEHSLTPPQARGNTNAGDVCFASGSMEIPAYKMSIRAEYARSIDNYFSKFGYKVNRLKQANQTGRATWNYVQIGTNEIIGYQKTDYLAIPPEDLVNINKLYQRGITIWHSHSTLGDYTQSNGIVSS